MSIGLSSSCLSDGVDPTWSLIAPPGRSFLASVTGEAESRECEDAVGRLDRATPSFETGDDTAAWLSNRSARPEEA